MVAIEGTVTTTPHLMRHDRSRLLRSAMSPSCHACTNRLTNRTSHRHGFCVVCLERSHVTAEDDLGGEG